MVVTFTGDLSITGSFKKKIISNSEIFSDDFLSDLKKSDFVVANLEGPTTNSKYFFNDNTPLKSPTNTITYLNKRNISVFNLANNHILDYGEVGLKNTLLEIKDENCDYFGADLSREKSIKPIIIKKEGISIALLGIAKCTPSKIKNAQLFSSDDFTTLKQQIKKIKSKVDFIFVNFHGGEEYTLYPSPVKRKFLKKIANLDDVSCVIAHHSHTLQGYEIYKNKPIFYSLGNFIFDIPNHKPYAETNNGSLIKFHFTKRKLTFTFIPFNIGKGEITKRDFSNFETKYNELCNFTNYKKKWQKEAFRILFRKENPLIKVDKNEKTLQNKSLISIFISKSFYIKAYKVIRDKYSFSVYYNAIIYKLKKRFFYDN